MYQIAIAVVVLITVGVVLYLFLRKKDTAAPGTSPSTALQPWTNDQLIMTLDAIRKMLPKDIDKQSTDCLISELSRKMSFKDFMSKNDTQRYDALFGVKGQFSDCMKRNMIHALMETTKNGPCSLCVVGTLEQNYSPFDINTKSEKDIGAIIEQIMMSCDACKSK
jgi:hypothetical protein